MNREKALAKNTFILMLGAFLPKLAAMVTLPILTGYLTASEFGTYDLVVTLVSLLLPAVTFQIQSAAFRFLITCRDDKEQCSSIITNIFAFTIPVSLITATLFFLLVRGLSPYIKLLIALYFIVDIMLITTRQITRGLGDNWGFAVEAITNSVVMLGFVSLNLLWLHKGLDGVLIAFIGASLWSLVFLSFRTHLFDYISLKPVSVAKIKEMLAYSWPMVPNNLSGWVLSLSDRLVITGFLGVEMNAVYAAANKIPNLMKTVQATFTYAWQENASLSVNDNDKEAYYSKMFEYISSLLSIAMACLLAITPIMFPLLIRGNYSDAYYQIPILYMGEYFSVLAAIVGGIYIAHMRTKNVGITTTLAATCNLLIDLLLIKKIGIFAGSISTLVSYFILTAYRMYDVRKFQPMKYDLKKLFMQVALLVLMGIFVFQRSLVFDLINGAIALIYVFVIEKDMTFKLINIVLNRLKKKTATAA